MCRMNSDVEELYVETIEALVQKGQPFSGYDLTVETRKREGVKLRHGDYRQGIHEIPKLVDLVDYDDWSKSLISLQNGQQVFVYHPNGFDLSQYEPMTDNYSKGASQNQSSMPITPNVCTAAPSGISGVTLSSDDSDDGDADDVGGEQSDGTFKVDCRGRLFIQTKFLRGAGVDPHEDVYVVVKPGEILLSETSHNHSNYKSITKRKVERNGDIRLARQALQSANMTGDYFTITNTDDGVLIKE